MTVDDCHGEEWVMVVGWSRSGWLDLDEERTKMSFFVQQTLFAGQGHVQSERYVDGWVLGLDDLSASAEWVSGAQVINELVQVDEDGDLDQVLEVLMEDVKC